MILEDCLGLVCCLMVKRKLTLFLFEKSATCQPLLLVEKTFFFKKKLKKCP